MNRPTGLAGRLAAAFVHSKLTPLTIVGSLALGALAVVALPREEEPQIVVPMIDVFVSMPGASPAEVEQRVTKPLEKLLWEIPGVEYLYSTSSPGQSLVIVRFLVGEDEERALVRLNQKISANLDIIPHGVMAPLVKPRSIDDVPVMALTLWGERYDDRQLRRFAAEIRDSVKTIADVSEVAIIGGRPRQVTLTLDPARLAAYGVDPLQVQRAIGSANARSASTVAVQGGREIVDAGHWLDRVERVGDVVVANVNGRAVLVRDVADVGEGAAEPTSYVTYRGRDGRTWPAVTVAISKRKGTNAIDITHQVEQKIETVRGSVLPTDLQVEHTRNYGETASEKSNELLWHMLLAVLSVSALIWLALGRREAGVVLIAIPVTLALTLAVFYLYGYTLNRITLFALIFSIGILVDDAIVVVENVVRHARMGGGASMAAIAIRAVDEVGNPTILATLTVVAAILPMAFVGGMMGPYMRPIPVGATAAMIFSLIVAFIVTPWAAVRMLPRRGGHHHEGEDRLTALYRLVMSPLIASRRLALIFLAGIAGLLLLATALVPLGLVTVKMLPFDNKSEFQVMVDMPEGTPLEDTARVTAALADTVATDPAVTSVVTYAGTSAPYNFNGLVRHYFLRQAPHQGDLQVNLLPKDERSEQSHAIAKRVRERIAPMAARFGARVQVTEVPPGPPVLQTLVAEVYGPDSARRVELARQVRGIFEATPGVVDVDWYVEDAQRKRRLDVDAERAAAAGVSADAVAAVVRMANAGAPAGLLHDERSLEDVPIVLRMPRELRGATEALRALRIVSPASGRSIALGDVTRETSTLEQSSIYHKNLQPVTYVIGDIAGAQESPVYAVLQMRGPLTDLPMPEGYAFDLYSARQPFDTTRYAMKWDGEWHITYEVFRDLGLAFAAVLVLIYILVVGWFQSFRTPLTIMAAIPFSLVGILPAHALMGAFFTATSMIGFIAGAGIVVRNSIILVDFIELRLQDGMSLEQAVIDAGAVRFRPMALTAAAVIVGAGVILFDPIFQGLAISLMAGEVASLLLSRMAVPILYYLGNRRQAAVGPEPSLATAEA
ncbi:MAG TPA: efflux RND transporter permease subunit [Vicinamibacterales bacterium]|nr:efflux RND transporter permease subunit [Vicinamibacterales bacterium]